MILRTCLSAYEIGGPAGSTEVFGIRKLRWRVEGAGKRGGVRVAYYWHVGAVQLFFLYAFGKNEQDNLTRDQIKALRKTVEAEFGS